MMGIESVRYDIVRVEWFSPLFVGARGVLCRADHISYVGIQSRDVLLCVVLSRSRSDPIDPEVDKSGDNKPAFS